ncbi:ribonuclease P protein component [Winogradskyella maritima]|uniref:Ribonuclease P protein component n=1 Tax=Winogradskyella maritima TaxID=1517766 RepID=A0ABV8ADR3_9FLAO|nr:ribonuclease P protein component [Winogradskyella maritima]
MARFFRLMSFKYPKQEKLKSKRTIDQLFTEGQSVAAYPLRLVYLKTEFEDNSPVKTGVSVSKRYFKKAVDRNRIKRLLREAYRLNKPQINTKDEQFAFMILYIGNTMPDYETVEKATQKLFGKFEKAISK